MLFSISGSQGCGKTTLVESLKDNYGLVNIGRKTARSILTDWNTSLEDVYTDLDTLSDFQTEILNRKQLDEQDHIYSNDVIITERSYMDLFAYATVYFGGLPQYSDWLDHYYEQCCVLQSNYISTIYLTRGDVPLINDGVRPCNIHYANLVDQYLQYLLGNNYVVTKFESKFNDTIVDQVYQYIDYVSK